MGCCVARVERATMTHDNRNRLTVALGAAWRPLWGAWQLPDGARAIGTVRRGKGTGALLWLADDTYAIGIDGVVERLHQMKAAYAIATAPKRFGGATAGGGRKSVDGAGDGGAASTSTTIRPPS